jgi:hypothetical protein
MHHCTTQSQQILQQMQLKMLMLLMPQLLWRQVTAAAAALQTER